MKILLYFNKKVKTWNKKHVRYQLCYLQFETELRSYRDLSGLIILRRPYTVIVFVYVNCKAM